MSRMFLRMLSMFIFVSFLIGFATTTEAQNRLFFPNRARNKTAIPSQPPKTVTMNEESIKLKVLLDIYQTEAFELFKQSTYAEWDAMTTGKEEAFKKSADAKLKWAEYHSNKEKYATIKDLRSKAVGFSEIDVRAAERMELQYAQNQLPPELLKKMLDMSSEIEKTFQNQRPKLDGQEYTNNDLLEMLEKETDLVKRRKIWEALKQVGDEVDDQVIALAKVRNDAARQLGFKNYWEMQVVFQDYKPDELLAIFEELETTTAPIFAEMKQELDTELAAKFNIPVDQLMPWHYDNPFFQQAPPSKEVDPNLFYKDKTKEEIIAIAVKYYKHLGFPYEEVLKRSDMFEREGKNQHAFSIDMDTLGDVRNLCNVKPTAEWMDTVLHEGGHGVYSLNCNRNLPFNLRDSAHIFTTEGIAMMFGAKARTPQWMIRFAGMNPQTVNNAAEALRKQRRREQLIFCRWTIVMLHFEKMLYENPDADLKTLWWEMVTKYQLLKRPEGRNAGDWASKPHFVIAPVYYHNYMLGELFAAQLRQSLGKVFTNDDPKIGRILTEKVFAPGAKYSWPQFVEQATGQPLSPKAFSNELSQSQ
ncbi:MAG: M2 family metallopeptidase [Planctomycetaceae bacterium]|nr:M2 family metallopeptidase [Planctomycetaceae bacterium]